MVNKNAVVSIMMPPTPTTWHASMFLVTTVPSHTLFTPPCLNCPSHRLIKIQHPLPTIEKIFTQQAILHCALHPLHIPTTSKFPNYIANEISSPSNIFPFSLLNLHPHKQNPAIHQPAIHKDANWALSYG